MAAVAVVGMAADGPDAEVPEVLDEPGLGARAGDVLAPLLCVPAMAVLEDCVHQLAVLGSIAPPGVDKRQILESDLGEEISRIVSGQKRLEAKYERLSRLRGTLVQQGATQAELDSNEAKLRDTSNALKRSTQELLKTLKQSPGAPEDAVKLHTERRGVQDTIVATLESLVSRGSFEPLRARVEQEEERQSGITEVVGREEQARQRVRKLKAALKRLKIDKKLKIEEREEEICQLKDHLQETKARFQLETQFVKKDAEVQVLMTQKRCNLSLKDLTERTEELQAAIRDETAANREVDAFLKENHVTMTDKVEEWMSKYEGETEAKAKELETLKSDFARDVNKLQELTEEFGEYEKVCTSNRERKIRQHKAAHQAVLELAAAVRLQAWWRGQLVRHKLGPFKAKKAKKGKGKKKGKKKK